MATPTSLANVPKKTSPFRLRFGLGTLLAVVTLCAVGAWYWWRLPFEVERTGLKTPAWGEYRIVMMPWSAADSVSKADPFAAPADASRRASSPTTKAKTNPPSETKLVEVQVLVEVQLVVAREVETVRRVWGGKTIRHGPFTSFDQEGHKIAEVHYREGRLHGQSRKWFSDGRIRERGQYQLGRKQGEWIRFHQNPDHKPPRILYSKSVSRWEDGSPHGKWEWHDAQGKLTLAMEFADGKLIGPLPPGADAGLAQRLAEGEIDNADLVFKLLSPMLIEFLETPLKDGLEFIEASVGFPLEIDARRLEESGISIDRPVTLQLPPETPLIMAIGMILRPLNLVCDYRFGVLHVTTPECFEAGDLTGIEQINPPRDARLAQVWDAPVSIEFLETPLVDALHYIAAQTDGRLQVDLTHLPKTYEKLPVTRTTAGLPLRHTLGLILDDFGWRCRLEGESLVLEEQEKSPLNVNE